MTKVGSHLVGAMANTGSAYWKVLGLVKYSTPLEVFRAQPFIPLSERCYPSERRRNLCAYLDQGRGRANATNAVGSPTSPLAAYLSISGEKGHIVPQRSWGCCYQSADWWGAGCMKPKSQGKGPSPPRPQGCRCSAVPRQQEGARESPRPPAPLGIVCPSFLQNSWEAASSGVASRAPARRQPATGQKIWTGSAFAPQWQPWMSAALPPCCWRKQSQLCPTPTPTPVCLSQALHGEARHRKMQSVHISTLLKMF